MAAPDFSVTDVVGRGVNFAQANWRKVLGVLLLAAVTATLAAGFDYAGQDGPAGLFSLANSLVSLLATAGLLRLAFQEDQPSRPDFRLGSQGFQWGQPETNLLLVSLLLLFWAFLAALALIFVLVVLALALGLSGAGASLSGASPEQLAEQLGVGAAAGLLLLLLVFVLAVLWVSVRLTLYPTATVADGRVRLFSTWRYTKGRFWKILGAIILASLPMILTSILASGVVEALGHTVAGDEEAKVLDLGPALALGLVTGVVVSLIQLPLTTGVYAELYRRLGPAIPPEPVVDEKA